MRWCKPPQLPPAQSGVHVGNICAQTRPMSCRVLICCRANAAMTDTGRRPAAAAADAKRHKAGKDNLARKSCND